MPGQGDVAEQVGMQRKGDDPPTTTHHELVDVLDDAVGLTEQVVVHDVVVEHEGAVILDLVDGDDRVALEAVVVVHGVEVDHVERRVGIGGEHVEAQPLGDLHLIAVAGEPFLEVVPVGRVAEDPLRGASPVLVVLVHREGVDGHEPLGLEAFDDDLGELAEGDTHLGHVPAPGTVERGDELGPVGEEPGPVHVLGAQLWHFGMGVMHGAAPRSGPAYEDGADPCTRMGTVSLPGAA